MVKRAFLKPADGQRVRRPDGVHLREGGESVVLDAYWRRRIKDGAVVEATPSKPERQKASTGTKKSDKPEE